MASHTKPRYCNQPQHPAHDDIYLDIRVCRFIHKTMVLTPNECAGIWPFPCNIEVFVLNRGRPPLHFPLDLATMYRSQCGVDIHSLCERVHRLSIILDAGEWLKDVIVGPNRTDISGSENPLMLDASAAKKTLQQSRENQMLVVRLIGERLSALSTQA